MYTFQYTVGDWSNDGHGQTDVFFLKSSETAQDLNAAFKAGVKVIGHDVTSMCDGYEDNTIPEEVAQAFIDVGVEFDEPYEGEVWVGPENIMDMVIATIKAGNPNITLEIVNCEDLAHTIGSVGYGCYS